MGCDDRYYDPGAELERDRLWVLRQELLRQVKTTPLTKLTLEEVFNFIEVIRPSYKYHEFSERDADLLRAIIVKNNE